MLYVQVNFGLQSSIILNKPVVMLTVKSIIADVYGTDAEAASAFKVGRSAICNYKAWGHFPPRLLPQIMRDAAAKGASITIDDIPLTREAA